MPELHQIPVNPFARAGAEAYDPKTREVRVHPTSTLYSMMHEQAHAMQHKENTWCWRLAQIRILGRRSPECALWLEIDAMLRARTILCYLGKWNHNAAREARESLLTYCGGPISRWVVNDLLNWSIQISSR
jgi:Zn-dependent membrane protease YugP